MGSSIWLQIILLTICLCHVTANKSCFCPIKNDVAVLEHPSRYSHVLLSIGKDHCFEATLTKGWASLQAQSRVSMLFFESCLFGFVCLDIVILLNNTPSTVHEVLALPRYRRLNISKIVERDAFLYECLV